MIQQASSPEDVLVTLCLSSPTLGRALVTWKSFQIRKSEWKPQSWWLPSPRNPALPTPSQSVSNPLPQQGIPFLLRLPESVSVACIKEISSDSTALGQYLKGFLFSWGECGCTQKDKLRPKDENQDFQSTWLKKTFHPPEHAGIIKDWMSQRSVHKFS